MNNGSPTAYLLWAILSAIFLAFLILHLWLYDRFNCLKWNSGRQPGAFKRIMTYSYLATVPLLLIFSVAMTAVKFQEGYIIFHDKIIIPRPLSLYAPHNKRWLVPLFFVFSMAWALEIVTHLEELAFWLFLLHQGPQKREWFESWEYRTWYFGSMIALLGMPLTTVVARTDIDRTQAWIFLSGSAASTTTTVFFLYVLFRFPAFIQHVKQGGADPDVVVRLVNFYNLNRIRVIFRFLFTIPLLCIAIDVVSRLYLIVKHAFALDFLLMLGCIGCFVSSSITLLVFFPRSTTTEAGYGHTVISPGHSSKVPTSPLPEYVHEQPHPRHHAAAHPHFRQEPSFEYDPSSPKDYAPASPSSPASFPHHGFRHGHGHHRTKPSPSYIYHSSSMPARPRPSIVGEEGDVDPAEGEESESSPEYESEAEDADSVIIGSPGSVSFPMHQQVAGLHGHEREEPPSSSGPSGGPTGQPLPEQLDYTLQTLTVRQNSSQTAVSRPTSGGKSEDTMWEPQGKSTGAAATEANSAALRSPPRSRPGTGGSVGPSARSVWARRRLSDTPFVMRQPGANVSEAPGSLPTSEESSHGHGRSGLGRRSSARDVARPRRHSEREPNTVLHPYLMNWTTPLDLLDTSPPPSAINHSHSHAHSSRMV